ncbi:hypothetical protein WKR88_18020 [Trinickia caryophylli]|uniref:Uncharacterized protein n=1 Tax=Trinickia caryophylli TaxID=28094 RepID=A0A1X7DZ13_TRICW|nr:hypothetical protein [Trinickia caryophylli]WQE11419.1 hypothetical protein U0034_16960 [Trinickia caryophylli]GLU32583.1 hypothetical protein Busp01_24250 [Trinickia caryophylli]SMF24408.1 hypothetical protein SAMN06295900_104277 [Trinickia caryophylli]
MRIDGTAPPIVAQVSGPRASLAPHTSGASHPWGTGSEAPQALLATCPLAQRLAGAVGAAPGKIGSAVSIIAAVRLPALGRFELHAVVTEEILALTLRVETIRAQAWAERNREALEARMRERAKHPVRLSVVPW